MSLVVENGRGHQETPPHLHRCVTVMVVSQNAMLRSHSDKIMKSYLLDASAWVARVEDINNLVFVSFICSIKSCTSLWASI